MAGNDPINAPGGGLIINWPHPPAQGYGGVGYGQQQFGSGAPLIGLGAAPKVGFGQQQFGLGPFGGQALVAPTVSSARSTSGTVVEVFFSGDMLASYAITSPDSYTITPDAQSAGVTLLSVATGSVTGSGITSILLTHSGTTLGGTYTVTVTGLTDTNGNPINLGGNSASFLALGTTPALTGVTVTAPDAIRLDFNEALLTQSQWTGVETAANYTLATTYPVDLTPTTITYPAPPNTHTGTALAADTDKLSLAPDASPDNGYYDGWDVLLTGGTGAGQAAIVLGYVGASQEVTITNFWGTLPDATTTYTLTAPVDTTHVAMTVKGMTTASYTVTAGPALAYDYNTSVLPSADTALTGSSVGTGTSSASAATDLWVSAELGNSYGWKWLALPAVWPATGTYKADFTFNPPAAAHYPALYNTNYGTLTVSDGATQLDIVFARVSNSDVVTITSGAYSQQVAVAWSNASTSYSVVRNQKAGTYTFLANGTPFATSIVAALTGADSMGAGIQFVTSGAYRVTQLPITQVKVTASATLFSASYNAIHETTATFTPSAAEATQVRNWLYTQHGPLVKDWGDATPATPNDVTLTVAGIEVDVADVNPYTGKVTATIPIPLMPTGEVDVTLDYKWQHTPVFDFQGLNKQGLVLNKWDQIGSPSPDQTSKDSTGERAHSTTRFPYGIVLGGKRHRPRAKRIGHKYLGTEKAYTAALNRPNSLLLNRSPHKIAHEALEKLTPSTQEVYEAEAAPVTPWVLVGTDTGSALGDGTYQLIDGNTGGYPAASAAYYQTPVDLSDPGSLTAVARYKVTAQVADGVFTGIAWGLHDNRRLYLVGALTINGLKHTGVLVNATAPGLTTSWILGPSAVATITSTTTCTVPTTSWPVWAGVGTQFQVIAGHPQAAVYKVETFTQNADTGLTTITLDTGAGLAGTWPADYNLYGNQSPTLVFETDWAESITYRMAASYQSGTAVVTIGNWASITVTAQTTLPLPYQTTYVFDTDGQGQVFWGSTSRLATNTSTWSYVRYQHTPSQKVQKANQVLVRAELGTLPENDLNAEWYPLHPYGHSFVDSTADQVVIDGSSTVAGHTYGYARQEPLLSSGVYADTEVRFQEHAGTVPGSLRLVVQDGQRAVTLGTLLYATSGSTRALFSLPQSSASMGVLPTTEGWAEDSAFTITPSVAGRLLTTTQITSTNGTYRYTNTTPQGTGVGVGAAFSARVAISSYTAASNGDIGVIFGGNGYAPFDINCYITLRAAAGSTPAKVVLHEGVTTQAATFDWDDGLPHSYRCTLVETDPTTCTITFEADDTVLGTLVVFIPSNTVTQGAYFGHTGTNATVAVWHSFYWHSLPNESQASRTLGLWRGHLSTDETDIDNWVIPRTDGTTALNSDDATATPVVWDWREWVQARIYLDPSYGALLYRPDLPMPAGYSGNLDAYATYTTNPTAAWAAVEYKQLPTSSTSYGVVQWGALASAGLSYQRWAYVRYRLTNNPAGNEVNPSGHVLNRYHYLNSGELGNDITIETVVIAAATTNHVLLTAADMTALRVFTVTINNVVLATTAYSFDVDSQTLTLSSAVAVGTPVTVTFLPGNPVTETYLQAQPVIDSVTLLNEGTPPVPKHQVNGSTIVKVSGSALNELSDVLNNDQDFVLNDPLQHLEHKDDADALYEQMSFYEVADTGTTGLLATIREGPRPVYTTEWQGTVSTLGDVFSLSATGQSEINLAQSTVQPVAEVLQITDSGDAVRESSTWSFDSATQIITFDPQLGQVEVSTVLYRSGYRGATFAENHGLGLRGPEFPQESMLSCSGGNVVTGGVLGGGAIGAIMYPNFSGGINRRTHYDMAIAGTDYSEVMTLAATADNVPATAHANEASAPAGAAGANSNGKVYYSMLHPGNNPVVGPAGGLPMLNPDPVVIQVVTNGNLVDGDTILINGDVLTARAAGAGADEFNIGGTGAATATNIATAIGASATYTDVTAAAVGDLVNLTGTPPALPPAAPALQSGTGIYVSTTAVAALMLSGEPYTQGSLLYGGTPASDTYHNGSATGVPAMGSGLFTLGGSLLKVGNVTTGTLQPAL